MMLKAQSCSAAISMSRPKNATFTIRGYGKIGSFSVGLREKLCSILRRGALQTRFGCTRRRADTTRGGTIAREDFDATLAYESITFGFRRHSLPGAERRGSIKNRGGGSGHPIMLRWLRSLNSFAFPA